MYNPLLDTFAACAEYKSFNKASTHLFISPTAVMKQINTLEEQVGFRLFERTAGGLELTPAGERLYSDTEFIRDYSEKALAAARLLAEDDEHTFCVGTSLLNPAKPFMDLWYSHNAAFQDYKLHLVPFSDDHSSILQEIGQLGVKFDFLIGVCDSAEWLKRANFYQLGTYRKMAAVRRGHPLAARKTLKISDLNHYTLMMVKAGDSPANDAIRYDLTEHYPAIRIEDTGHYYDLSVFNRCAESDKVLLTIECWKDVHPGLVTIPVEWDYTIPYGILYPLHPDKDIQCFIDIISS
jgi:DNA-binding transcriptional LysR family regulator